MQNRISIIKFADVKIPTFRELKNDSYISFGANNKFPSELLEFFNKSSKHNGIILGKVNYIVGNGFNTKFVPNKYETANELLKKLCLDIEVFGGCYIEVQYGGNGEPVAHFHIPFYKVRSNKDNTQFFIKDWDGYKNGEPKVLLAYNPNMNKSEVKNTSQILFYKEYRPGLEVYPLPNYLGALNSIKTDIEISKYHLSTISNGMFASKMITLFEGVNSEEEKKEIEKAFKDKFTGSENAGSIVINYGKDPAKKPIIEDLSNTDLDKHFDILSKSVSQEIFAGHQITSPMLFGIRVEGQLGGRSEMREAYEIFKNTYINDKQMALEQLFLEISGKEQKIIPVEPIAFELTEQTLVQIAPKEWLLEKAGIDASKYEPKQPEVTDPVTGEPIVEQPVNENLKNMTGRQWQNVSRIIRNFSNGKITVEQAKLLLKSSLGLSDEEINTMLSIDNEQEFSAQDRDELMLLEFTKIGEPKQDYEVLKSKTVFHFADDLVTQLETDVLDLIKKDRKITIEVIAEALQVKSTAVHKIIAALEDKGYLTSKATRVGQDVIIERKLTEPLSKVSNEKPKTLDYQIMYSYEGPKDDRNRAFCARLLELDKFYKRTEIEQMSRTLGYSVWDRRGGWWNTGTETKVHCRHDWKMNIVIKKK